MTAVSKEVSSGKLSSLLLTARPIERKFQCILPFTLSSTFDSSLSSRTWFNDHAPDNAMTIPGCNAFRKSCQTMSENPYQISRVGTTAEYHLGCVWLSAEMVNKGILAGCAYRSHGKGDFLMITDKLTIFSGLPGPNLTTIASNATGDCCSKLSFLDYLLFILGRIHHDGRTQRK